eukprot:3655818-Rhodomonas_salina.3
MPQGIEGWRALPKPKSESVTVCAGTVIILYCKGKVTREGKSEVSELVKHFKPREFRPRSILVHFYQRVAPPVWHYGDCISLLKDSEIFSMLRSGSTTKKAIPSNAAAAVP